MTQSTVSPYALPSTYTLMFSPSTIKGLGFAFATGKETDPVTWILKYRELQQFPTERLTHGNPEDFSLLLLYWLYL